MLEQVIEGCRERGCLVLLDVKRGDIGTTAQAYADAYLDSNSPLAVDAITVSPYLGIGSLDPFFDTALANDAGVFVLALTSNPEGPQVQHALTADGRSLAGLVLDAVATHNAGVEGLGSIGAVVGATVELPSDLGVANLDVNGPLLVPGIGAQGGTLDDVRRVFGEAARNVLPDQLPRAARRRAGQGRAPRRRPSRPRPLPAAGRLTPRPPAVTRGYGRWTHGMPLAKRPRRWQS